MAEQKRNTGNGADNDAAGLRGAAIGVMADAQERLVAGAGQVAERLPDALAGAQVAARDTQRALDAMPDQSLIIGASFSLGVAVGLFFGGVNRLLVMLALLPAAAMATTLVRRSDEAGARSAAAGKRSTPSSA